MGKWIFIAFQMVSKPGISQSGIRSLDNNHLICRIMHDSTNLFGCHEAQDDFLQPKMDFLTEFLKMFQTLIYIYLLNDVQCVLIFSEFPNLIRATLDKFIRNSLFVPRSINGFWLSVRQRSEEVEYKFDLVQNE